MTTVWKVVNTELSAHKKQCEAFLCGSEKAQIYRKISSFCADV
jgi:hypothetical protein